MKETILTIEQLQDRMVYWQEKLRLQDWMIKIKIARANEMEANRNAEIAFIYDNKQAYIKILDNMDHPKDAWFEHDMEWSLVHELLHLHLGQIRQGENIDSVEEEQAIESIVYGLIALDRR